MKILKTLFKNFRYLKNRYLLFKTQPLTKKKPLYTLLKYVYINLQLYFFKKEISFVFLDKINVKAVKGDGIIGNYHSILEEANDSVFLLHFLNQTDVFLDVGANVGHYTLLAAVIKQSKVIAIEPIPTTYTRLIQNITINNIQDRVTTHNIGLSNIPGELAFSNNQFTTNRVNNSGLGIKVDVKTIDELFLEKKINAIKIDVEGFEWFVLNGAKETLKMKDLNVIIIELNDSGIEYGINDEQIVTFLRSYGFFQYEYDIFSRKLTPIKSKNTKQFNTIFIKDLLFVTNKINNSPKIQITRNLNL